MSHNSRFWKVRARGTAALHSRMQCRGWGPLPEAGGYRNMTSYRGRLMGSMPQAATLHAARFTRALSHAGSDRQQPSIDLSNTAGWVTLCERYRNVCPSPRVTVIVTGVIEGATCERS